MWQDSTSYSRDQKERIPSCWTAKAGSLKITVLNGHIYHPGEWVMHCFELGIDTKEMGLPKESTPEQAQEKAVAIVRQKLNGMLIALNTNF
jgi:hypothetical protein